MKHFHYLKSCRACSSEKLFKYLDLGSTPLANNLVKSKPQVEDSYPLEVVYCENCSLSQLSVVVDPAIMFRDYCYRSSISQTFVAHCQTIAEAALKHCSASNSLAVDIASNDGTLLQAFKKRGFKVMGIDPAINLAEIANKEGVPTVAEFWSADLAAKLAQKGEKATVMTATNVFAHVDNIHDFVEGISKFLAPNGLFIIEFPYLVDFIEHNEFDTVYHEHLSYFLLKPIAGVFEKYGLKVFDVAHQPIHGGSLRVFVKHAANEHIKVQASVANLLSKEFEQGYHSRKLYEAFGGRVRKIREDLVALCKKIKSEGKNIIGYGASAKGNTLLNYCGVGTQYIDMIIDDTPEKQNNFTPGQQIPIRSRDALTNAKCDYMLILPWNFKDELMRKTAHLKTNYIIPIPNVTVVPHS